MRYVINFQIKITKDQSLNEIIRSSYTILEKEAKEYNLSSISNVESWFKNFFKQQPLDYFIDTSKMKIKSNFEMKIGRITDSTSGNYKTY